MKKLLSFLILGTIIVSVFVMPISTKATSIKPPTKIKVSAKVAGFTIKYSKSKSKVTGYKLQYALSKDFKGSKTITLNKNTTKKTVKKLKSGKKYYVRVRAYRGSSYSKWSAKKSIVTKLSASSMKKIAVGYWFVYSPQDTVADAYKITSDGKADVYTATCNEYTNSISYEKKAYRNMWCVYSVNSFIVRSPAFADVNVKYVPIKDYGKYVKNVPIGPADSKKVTFKVYHYKKKPTVKTFLKHWNKKYA